MDLESAKKLIAEEKKRETEKQRKKLLDNQGQIDAINKRNGVTQRSAIQCQKCGAIDSDGTVILSEIIKNPKVPTESALRSGHKD